MPKIPSTISGITFSQAKRIAKNEFESDMIKIIQSDDYTTYDVYVGEASLDKRKIEKFKKCWNMAFRIFPIEVKKPV